MIRNKCLRCELVNAATDTTCRRCGASLSGEEVAEVPVVEETVQRRGIGRRLIWIAGTTVLLLFIFYMSQLLTSEDLDYEQTQTVNKAIALLEEKGLEAALLYCAGWYDIAAQIAGGTNLWVTMMLMRQQIFLSKY